MAEEKQGLVAEFKEFISQGNVLDLAVAVVIGAAFGAIVTSFVNDILMQIIAAVGGQPDFSSLTITIGEGVIRYGSFINAVISFLIIAFAIFLVVKAVNRMRAMRTSAEDDESQNIEEAELEVLQDIRELLRQER